jgi:hypothetical protein
VGRVGGDRVAIEKQSKKGTPVASPSRPAATPAVPASSLPFFIGVPPRDMKVACFTYPVRRGTFQYYNRCIYFPAPPPSPSGVTFFLVRKFLCCGAA